jgi:vacuolar protein sorting-associated protein 35
MDAAVSVELFVEILNRYVYYFDQENEAVSKELFSVIDPLSSLLISSGYEMSSLG